eukprot:TRINITY_DN152_c5_g1_i1.p1 TRINITY_DN152_c5_g1~~TRINITY_DN152_c5_g1_i1.p1  ORF type:complete len:1034 (+),score=290.67 TRINITY_DN152_c5_g1_i1:145-3102(+)
MTAQWVPRQRDWVKEKESGLLEPELSLDDHPLLEALKEQKREQEEAAAREKAEKEAKEAARKKEKKERKRKEREREREKKKNGGVSGGLTEVTDDFDPLSGGADPLSGGSDPFQESMVVGVTNIKSVSESRRPHISDAPVWESKKGPILNKYTTNEAIPVPSFVKGVGPKVTVATDRVKNRLEQLDEEEGDEVMLKLTQKDYQDHIEKRRTELISAWETDKRVKALRVAIKCAKLLGDTTQVIQFYPTKFVLISEILDTFGRLVFDRLKLRSNIVLDDGVAIPLKDDFRADDVADHSKETCRNWFFKTASIRELLPRLYMEMAILECYRFLENDAFPKAFERINKMIRGVADPLVAQYARAYLARKGVQLMKPNASQYLFDGFKDYLFVERRFATPWLKEHLELRRVERVVYLDLYSPALDWVLECIAYRGDQTLFEELLQQYAGSDNGFVLNAIISAFKPQLIASNALQLVSYIKAAASDNVDKVTLYRTLGVHLALASPRAKDKVSLLTSVWKDVKVVEDTDSYLQVAEVWIAYPLNHLSLREVNIILKDILTHVTVDKKYFEYQGHLHAIINKLLGNPAVKFTDIFAMKYFLPFLDLFRGETQTEVNKSLLSTFTRSPESVSDSRIITTMFAVAKTVHDSINALSLGDEKREITNLLSKFLQKIDFGNDVEKHLNFLVEARASFADLDTVKGELVSTACTLAVKTIRKVNNKLTKVSSSFVRACIAYAFITIPSMEDVFLRLSLYSLAGQVALLGQSVTQAETLFKSAIVLLKDLPTTIVGRDGKSYSSEPQLLTFVNNFMSILVAMPGHPEKGAFYLFDALYTVINRFEWELKSTARLEMNVALLRYLATTPQKKLPYEWSKVESNDVLFGQTAAHLKKVTKHVNSVLKDINKEIERLGNYADGNSQIEQAEVILELVNMSLCVTELSESQEVISNWISIARKRRATTKLLQLTKSIYTTFSTSSEGAVGGSSPLILKALA